MSGFTKILPEPGRGTAPLLAWGGVEGPRRVVLTAKCREQGACPTTILRMVPLALRALCESPVPGRIYA